MKIKSSATEREANCPLHVPFYTGKLIFEPYYYYLFILGALFGPKKNIQNVFHVIVQKFYQKKKFIVHKKKS